MFDMSLYCLVSSFKKNMTLEFNMKQQHSNTQDYFQQTANNKRSNNNQQQSNQSQGNEQQLKSAAARTLSQFNRNMEQMCDRFFNFMPGMNAMAEVMEEAMEQFMPQLLIHEEDGNYVFTCQIPAIDEDDIEIHVKNGLLMISYEGDESEERNESSGRQSSGRNNNRDRNESSGRQSFERNSNRDRQESRSQHTQSFSQIMPLPLMADSENIEATFKNGKLRIEIAKLQSDQAESSRIKVNANNKSRQDSDKKSSHDSDKNSNKSTVSHSDKNTKIASI
jgi:HSP20 family molecular chaperone IbpA